MIKLVASVVPILNGRDSEGNVICLGPQSTKIHRYLLVVFLAKSTQMFRLLGKEIDNSIYFTLYKLWQVANSFKDISPYHLPIRYDRTKVAIKIYNMISNTGLVAVSLVASNISSLVLAAIISLSMLVLYIVPQSYEVIGFAADKKIHFHT
jgi:hypothetical protein